jgi:hypothetical protein
MAVKGSRGIALDDKRSLLSAGCDEGSLNGIELVTGNILGRVYSGKGGSILSRTIPELGHVYLPGADGGTMSLVDVSAMGSPTVLKTVKTARGAHCVTNDNGVGIYVRKVRWTGTRRGRS